MTIEPERPTPCSNCGTSYDECTAGLRNQEWGAPCCGACFYTETHHQHAWESWDARRRERNEMMKTQYQDAVRAANAGETWPCPRCLHPTAEFPALSRKDNATAVCPKCGTEEGVRQFRGLAPWPSDDVWPFLASSQEGGR